MSSGNAYQEQLEEGLGAGAMEDVPAGKLEDAEIQRLVALSNDASYARSDRIPVKTVEAFEPRSLVSIAMAAQRRRESEMRTARAAGADIGDEAGEMPGDSVDAAEEVAVNAEQSGMVDTDDVSATTPQDPDGADGATDEIPGEDVAEPSSTSQVDFEAGRSEGLEEGRKLGFEEGQAKGMEEGRAAGRAEASAQLERAVQAFEAATTKLAELTEIDSAALSDSINRTILQLASDRAGHAIAELPNSFADRIEALLATIRTVSGQPSIRLNPGDLASIQPLAETREKLRHCNFVADPALAHGDLSVMIGTIGIDDMLLDPQETVKCVAQESKQPEISRDVSAQVSAPVSDGGQEENPEDPSEDGLKGEPTAKLGDQQDD